MNDDLYTKEEAIHLLYDARKRLADYGMKYKQLELRLRQGENREAAAKQAIEDLRNDLDYARGQLDVVKHNLRVREREIRENREAITALKRTLTARQEYYEDVIKREKELRGLSDRRIRSW